MRTQTFQNTSWAGPQGVFWIVWGSCGPQINQATIATIAIIATIATIGIVALTAITATIASGKAPFAKRPYWDSLLLDFITEVLLVELGDVFPQ